MYTRKVITLDEARTMAEAVFEESKKMSEAVIAVAIADDHGELVYFAREDGAPPMLVHMAQRKAYTAARVNTDTGPWADFQKKRGREISSWLTCDPKLTGIQGGAVIKLPGKGDGSPESMLSYKDTIGGVGVSGKWSEEDEKLARLAVKVFNDLNANQ
jgi:glc operon protein GlcG